MIRLLSLVSLVAALAALVASTLERRAPGRIPIIDLIRERFPRAGVGTRMAQILLGATLGFIGVAVPLGVYSAMGRLTAIRNDLSVALILPALATLTIKMIWAAAEEVIYRGALLPQIARRSNAWIALVISSILFSWAHLERSGARAPDGVALGVYLLDGIGFSLAFLATGALWLPTAWHAARNVSIWLLYGTSSLQLAPGLLKADTTPGFWTGASGQAGVVDLIASAVLAALMFVACRRSPAAGVIQQ